MLFKRQYHGPYNEYLFPYWFEDKDECGNRHEKTLDVAVRVYDDLMSLYLEPRSRISYLQYFIRGDTYSPRNCQREFVQIAGDILLNGPVLRSTSVCVCELFDYVWNCIHHEIEVHLDYLSFF